MKTGSCSITVVCFFIFLVLVTIPSVSAYGIGLGPTDLQINNVLRGTSVVRSITLYNLGDSASIVDLKSDGPGAGWIQFYDGDVKSVPITSLTMKARETRPIIIQITVPPDTANGIYNTTVHATLKPPETTKVQVGVIATMEATSTVSITVTGQQSVAGTVDYITIDTTEVNFPLPIKVLFHNTGNVAATPEITAAISGKSGIIDTISFSGTEVNAGNSEPIVVRWTKTNIEPGDYSADVKVNLAGAQIASKKIPFTIASTGTLSRQGNLTNLIYVGDPAVDAILKIIGTFENTGKIETKAKMVGEVYRDGTLVDTFSSDELSIPINDRGEFTYYLKAATPGLYTVKAYVLYEGKKTDLRDLTFTIAGTGAVGGKTSLLPAVTISALLGSIVLFVFKKQKSH